MFISTFQKYKHLTLLLAFTFWLTHFLSAQMSKTSLMPPLSISKDFVQENVVYNATEFMGLTAIELLPKALFQKDTTEMPIPPKVPKPNEIVVSEPQAEAVETPQTDTQTNVQTDVQIVENTVETSFYQDSTCIDLTFDSVSIVQITDKYVEIEYSIINKGNKAAPIFGEKRSTSDNVAVHFYYSGTPRLTRGAILADGIYLTEGLKETKGMLEPNAVYKNRFKLSLEKKNRFYGVIILQLDVFDVLRHECDETNNIFAIVPKWY